MVKKQDSPPPRRKEPGFLGNLFSTFIQFVVWLVISLIISIGIEWIGMTYYWTEQGSGHAKQVLMTDQAYINKQLHEQSLVIKGRVVEKTHQAVRWISEISWLRDSVQSSTVNNSGYFESYQAWAKKFYNQHYDYIQACVYVTQIFIIRLGLILFSLPIFTMAILVGAVDGLVERDLRRWGGGRESSNVFNLAKRSIVPAFVLACVVYISLPISIDPVLVILPFALILGMSVRVSFERLKKYF